MHTLLNRGKSVHQLQLRIYTGKISPERGRRRDGMIAISDSLTLLTNPVIAWNTQRMPTALDAGNAKGGGLTTTDCGGMGRRPLHMSISAEHSTFQLRVIVTCCWMRRLGDP